MLIRPFLQVFRTEIDAYLESIGQTCRTDSTNAQTDYTRNQLRHEILPLLRQKLNPRVDQALLQLSRQAAEAQEMVNEVATELLHAATLDRQQNSVRLQRSLLISHSPARLRALFTLLWDVQQWPRQSLGFAHLNELAGMVLHQTPSRLSLPGRIEANCRTAIVELRRRS